MSADTSVGDLLDEGRRYVLYVGEHHPGDGFRATIVFEDYPGYFPTGEISNRHDAAPVIWWQTNDMDAALDMAYEYSASQLGLSRTEHNRIIMSSMAATNRGRHVAVRRDPDSGDVWLHNGFDQEIKLEEDDAIALYQDLARAMDLPFRDNCPECHRILNYEELCEDCDY